MKLAHLADLHITEGPFFDRACTALRNAVEVGEDAHVNLWLIAGDIWGTTVPHRPTETERIRFANTVQAMAETAPVVIIYGNHDSRDVLTLMQRLNARHEILVSETTNLYELGDVAVVTAAYPRKGWLARGEHVDPIETTRIGLADRFETIIRLTLEQASAHVKHLVVLAHCNVAGSQVGGGEVLTGQEVELAPSAIEAWFQEYPRLRYVALGHIHRRQGVTLTAEFPGAWYAGALFAQNRGERHPHGFQIVELDVPDRPHAIHIEFIESPGPPLITYDMKIADHTAWFPDVTPDVAGADVLLRVHLAEEMRALDLQPFVQALEKMGAVNVTLTRKLIPRERARAESLLAGPSTLTEQLTHLWGLWQPPPDPQVAEAALAYLSKLEDAP